jgi:hypothetical protein
MVLTHVAKVIQQLKQFNNGVITTELTTTATKMLTAACQQHA